MLSCSLTLGFDGMAPRQGHILQIALLKVLGPIGDPLDSIKAQNTPMQQRLALIWPYIFKRGP